MEALLSACKKINEILPKGSPYQPVHRLLQTDLRLKDLAREVSKQLHSFSQVYLPAQSPAVRSLSALKAISWNIERGKNLDGLLRVFRSHPEFKQADLFLLTEVDWGMARSGNRNVAAELGEALGFYSYFAPSYYNFTNGHGFERNSEGENSLGLHGKAILSRFPLQDIQVIPMPNATDKLKSKEARLGEKRALLGSIALGEKKLNLACTHLDAFSSPKMRARQLGEALRGCQGEGPLLIAGDWNTNTLNSSNGPSIFLSVLKQILLTGPQKMVKEHYPFPYRAYDRPIFETLRRFGLDFEEYNEMGVGTFDLFTNDMELGQMANDQFPRWILKWINGLVKKNGGLVSLKLDWFAGRGLKGLAKKVLRLKSEEDFPAQERPSDHHPIVLDFEI